jgi:ABC-type multidrug transport system ATPase subunit
MRIATENLGKRFNREWIFKGLTRTFQTGICYAIIGPNGSGKSTLMQVLWGQVPPSEGQLTYFDRHDNPVLTEDVFKHISIATPYLELIDEFTLSEMVRFHFRFKNLKKDIRQEEVLDKMELAHAHAKRISQFSSGMKQRLKLALAFYSDTEVLFLDEPTTNLDSHATGWYLENLREQSDRIIFIASNQPHEYPESAQKIDLSTLKAKVTKKSL